MISDSKKKVVEIIILIIVSFSPLLSNLYKVALILMISALNIKNLKYTERKKDMMWFILFSLFAINIVNDLKNVSGIGQLSVLNIFFPLCFFLGFLISKKYEMEEYLYYLEKVVFVTAVCSLVGVCLYTFMPAMVYRLPSYYYYHTSHKTALLFNILMSDGGIVSRNAGIAWEPGAFQFLLNLGIYAHIKSAEKANILKIAIYGLAIIFTKSTAGIIIFIAITFNILRKDKIARWFIIILIIAFSDAVRQELAYQYNFKLFGSSAFADRLEPMINAYSIGKSRLWGLGNTGYDQYYRSLDIGAWDSFGQIFIRYGYGMYILISYFLLKLIKTHKILFLILFVTFLSQGIWFFAVVTPFYFMGLNRDKREFEERRQYEGTVDNKSAIAGSKYIDE